MRRGLNITDNVPGSGQAVQAKIALPQAVQAIILCVIELRPKAPPTFISTIPIPRVAAGIRAASQSMS